MIEQHIVDLAKGQTEVQDVLVIEGEVPYDEKAQFDAFNHEAKKILHGLNHKTAVN